MEQKKITYIRDFPRWGCYVASLASLAERHMHKPFGRRKFAKAYEAVKDNGSVLHNTIPVGSPGWARCYVQNPVLCANTLLEAAKVDIRVKSMHVGKPQEGDFTLVCFDTLWGVHFALGNSNGHVTVNPDPDLPLLRVNSYRIFALEV